MNGDLNSLYFKLKRAGMTSEASKVLNIIKSAQTYEPTDIDMMYNLTSINKDKKDFERDILYRDMKDAYDDQLEAKKEKELQDKYREEARKMNEFVFPSSSMDTPESFALESDDEHIGRHEDEGSEYEFGYVPEQGKKSRDVKREMIQDKSDFLSEESSKMRSGLKNIIRQSLPPKGKMEGDGNIYNTDARQYYSFLKRELGKEIDEIGLVSLDGTAKINLDVISETLLEKYNKLSEARKRRMLGAMIKKGFLKR